MDTIGSASLNWALHFGDMYVTTNTVDAFVLTANSCLHTLHYERRTRLNADTLCVYLVRLMSSQTSEAFVVYGYVVWRDATTEI